MNEQNLFDIEGIEHLKNILTKHGEIENIKPYHKSAVFINFKDEERGYVLSMRTQLEATLDDLG